MEVSPSFELVRCQDRALIFADVVRLPEGAAMRPSVVHFHPQLELVWFRKVRGCVLLEGERLPVADRQAVLLPSMQVHAFETGTGVRDWVLLQFEPSMIKALLPEMPMLARPRPLVLSPEPGDASRIDFLCNWLCEIVNRPDRALEAQQVMGLILVTLAATRPDSVTGVAETRPLGDAMQDALRQIHADPGNALSLAAAARAARVSDAHFARLFKSRVGMGYAAYVQMHRLNIAARDLLTGSVPVSQIAYRVGFASAAHFSTAFSERFGQSPRSFRQQGTDGAGAVQDGESE